MEKLDIKTIYRSVYLATSKSSVDLWWGIHQTFVKTDNILDQKQVNLNNFERLISYIKHFLIAV